MTVKLIRKNSLRTTLWSGGTTTELVIYPPEALYSDRNFIWRVSSACVEDEESVFTKLDGVERILMILDGELWLRHDGGEEFRLGRFGQTRFSGNRDTRSRGRVTDFNLMMKGCEGSVEMRVVDTDETPIDIFAAESRLRSDIFYALGDVAVNTGDAVYSLHCGDVLWIESNAGEKCKIKITPSNETVYIIHTTVFYSNPAS